MTQRSPNSLFRNQDGAVAVEFALTAPIMVLFMLSAFSLFDGFRAASRTHETASIVADIASRQTTMDADAAAELFATARALMAPALGRGDIQVTIVSVVHWPNPGPDGVCPGRDMPDNGCLTVSWGVTSDGSPAPNIAALVIPTIPRGESIIQAEIDLQYEYLFEVINETLETTAIATRRPRFTNEVLFP